MDPQAYPKLIPGLQGAAIRHFVRDLDWMRLEEKFCADQNLLNLCVEGLIKKKMLNEAFSIIKRQKLLSNPSIPFYLKKKFKPLCSDPSLVFLKNSLFELDDYAPTEEILKLNEPGTFITMGDLGLDIKKDLIYIEKIATSKFEQAVNEILNSRAVGLDTEFTSHLTKFDKQRIALLQIATNEKIYVFNVLKMKEKIDFAKYQNFVKDLLTNPEILKVFSVLLYIF